MTNTFKFFNTREEYINFRTKWKALANAKKATREDHIVYALIKRGTLDKAFTSVSNKTKLACNCGGNPKHFLNHALAIVGSHARHNSSYSCEMLKALSAEDKERLVKIISDIMGG